MGHHRAVPHQHTENGAPWGSATQWTWTRGRVELHLPFMDGCEVLWGSASHDIGVGYCGPSLMALGYGAVHVIHGSGAPCSSAIHSTWPRGTIGHGTVPPMGVASPMAQCHPMHMIMGHAGHLYSNQIRHQTCTHSSRAFSPTGHYHPIGQYPHNIRVQIMDEQCHATGQCPLWHTAMAHHEGSATLWEDATPTAEEHSPPARGHLPARWRRRVQRAVPWRLLTSQASGPAAPRPTRSSRRQCWSSSGIVISHVPSCSPSTCPPLWAHTISSACHPRVCAPKERLGCVLPLPGDSGLHVVDGDGDGGWLALHHVHYIRLVLDDWSLIQIGTCHTFCQHPSRSQHPALGLQPPVLPLHPSILLCTHPDPGASRAPPMGRACCWSWGWR